MKNLLKFTFLLSLLWGSCTKEEFDGQLNAGEYLTFGKYHFECGGNCTNLFKIEKGQLFQDDLDWGLLDEIPFQSVPLDNSKFEIAKILIEEFPNDLLESGKRKYGCPDCVDQGGFYVELKDGGERNIWLIDVLDDEQNQSIINYKLKIDEILKEL